jgi:hypothetical protein
MKNVNSRWQACLLDDLVKLSTNISMTKIMMIALKKRIRVEARTKFEIQLNPAKRFRWHSQTPRCHQLS